MSYVRFSTEVRKGVLSDIYIYDSVVDNKLHCCACRLSPNQYSWYDDYIACNHQDMIEHVGHHIEAGHNVPKRHPLPRLKKEWKAIQGCLKK